MLISAVDFRIIWLLSQIHNDIFMLSYGHIWLIQFFQFYSILFYIQQHLLIINDRPLINVYKKKITLYAFYLRRAFADLPSSQECFKRKILKPVMYKYRNTFYKRPLYNSSHVNNMSTKTSLRYNVDCNFNTFFL